MKPNSLLEKTRKILENLKRQDAKIFPNSIFHASKGIGIIHIKYGEQNKSNEIGEGVIFTHWKRNEKKKKHVVLYL